MAAAPEKRRLCILVVDDDDASSHSLQRLLTFNGHKVHVASTVAQALAIAKEVRCDLLISDLMFTDGTGTQLLQELSKIYHIVAIAVTGHVEPEYARECEQAGFASRLLKPVVFTELLSTIDGLFA